MVLWGQIRNIILIIADQRFVSFLFLIYYALKHDIIYGILSFIMR